MGFCGTYKPSGPCTSAACCRDIVSPSCDSHTRAHGESKPDPVFAPVSESADGVEQANGSPCDPNRRDLNDVRNLRTAPNDVERLRVEINLPEDNREALCGCADDQPLGSTRG